MLKKALFFAVTKKIYNYICAYTNNLNENEGNFRH